MAGVLPPLMTHCFSLYPYLSIVMLIGLWRRTEALVPEAPEAPQFHMLSFVDDNYRERMADSLRAKASYAKYWGYNFNIFNSSSIDCDEFRAVRWRGDIRYCKLQVLTVVFERLWTQGSKKADYLFWLDADTHIMRPKIALERFIEAAGDAAFVLTDNALSLNNGAFFLRVSEKGRKWLSHWRSVCSKGEWPWADNGCMYEAMLTFSFKDYTGSCQIYGEGSYSEQLPEPPTGTDLMDCFNKELDLLGSHCCGTVNRSIESFAFLTERNAFNHHPCEELMSSRIFQAYNRDLIRQHCFSEEMFMVHTKSHQYAERSLRIVSKFTVRRIDL